MATCPNSSPSSGTSRRPPGPRPPPAIRPRTGGPRTGGSTPEPAGSVSRDSPAPGRPWPPPATTGREEPTPPDAGAAGGPPVVGVGRCTVAPVASLADRLGYGPDAKLLILTCDDLGQSHAANAGVFDALRSGLGTSASLMVP